MKKLKIILLFSIIVLIIFRYANYKNYSKYNGIEKEIIGIINKIKIDGDKLTLEVSSKEKIIVNYYLKSEEEKNYYNNNLKLGDTYKFIGNLKTPSKNTNFNLFNYYNYLLSKNIF